MAEEPEIVLDFAKESLEARLDPVFEAAIESKRVPGVAAIALDKDGKVLFSKGYGSTSFGVEGAPGVTTKTPAYIYSCTKLMTSVAALQLVEKGKLQLDDPVEDYVPEFAKLQVLDGFDDQGQAVLRAPTTKAKIVNLMTHTTGLTYDFFDQNTLRYRVAQGPAPCTYGVTTTLEYFSTPLKFDPGTAYTYGVSTDWLGVVIERISGIRLNQYISQHILQPLGLQNTQYGGETEEFFNIHLKDETGNHLTPVPSARNNTEGGELVPGGQYLTSTAEDYAQFLLTILNHGTHPSSRVTILQPDTVHKYIFQDHLSSIIGPSDSDSNKGVGEITTALPQLSCTGTMLPGIEKGWSLGGLVTNSQSLPNGRRGGSGSWAGLDNCYYWIDPEAGKLGFLLGSTFPWFDRDHLHLFDSLERAVYGRPLAEVPGEKGSNFEGGHWWNG